MDSSKEEVLGERIHELELTLVEGFAKINATHKAHTQAMDIIVKTQDQLVDNLYGQGDDGLLPKIAGVAAAQRLIWSCIGGLGMVNMTLMVAHFAPKLPIA
tara:strand:- start:6762 stop:7064 length:303 start_codon:yes stop_codon:yes gene_type:complete